MRLENMADMAAGDPYPFETGSVLKTGPMIQAIAEDILKGEDPSLISGRFHRTIAGMIIQSVSRIRESEGLEKVALSGGTFQNRIISTLVENGLAEKGFRVYVPIKVPANDGGIALGQLAIAAKKRKMGT
jgi:hydrogenase maturation protein HypF